MKVITIQGKLQIPLVALFLVTPTLKELLFRRNIDDRQSRCRKLVEYLIRQMISL